MPSYTPPAGNAVYFVFNDIYGPPVGNAVNLDFNQPPPNTHWLSLTGQLDSVTVAVGLDNYPPAILIGQLEDTNALISLVPSAPVTEIGQLDDVLGTFYMGPMHEMALVVTLDDTVAVITSLWESGVYRGVWRTTCVDTGSSQDIINKPIFSEFNQSTKVDPIIPLLWQPPTVVDHESQSAWAESNHIQHDRIVLWQPPVALEHSSSSGYKSAPEVHADKLVDWQPSIPESALFGSFYTSPPAKDLERLIAYEKAITAVRDWLSDYGIASPKMSNWKTLPWEVADPHTWIWGGWPTPPEPPPPPFAGSPDLVFYQTAEDYTGGAILVFGKPCYAWPLQVHPQAPYINLGYAIVIHNLSVVRVSDLANIPVLSVSLRFDISSWAWQVSLNLETPAAFALIGPVAGVPCTVRVNIDGTYINAIIEEWGEQKQFGTTSYTASGRSPLALLAQPFAAQKSYSEASDRTAAQLIDQELFGSGWTAQYHDSFGTLFTTDWLVPAGAYSYQNRSPIESVLQIAKAVGARAYADKTAKIIHIDPRYPVSPWNWATTTPDKTIPQALIRNMSTQLAPQPDYNHIYVSGQNQGVLVSATMNGTAGDKPAPMVTDSLITFVNAGRERARNELSNVGMQSRVSMDLPMNSYTGLLEPGKLVEVTEASPWRGLVTGVSVSATLGAVAQQVEVERHY